MSNQADKKDYSKNTYVVLMETSGSECESWLSFIKVEGNEDAINSLQNQLEDIEFYILDELSTFDLETSRPVSYQTAKEMCKLDLNPYMPHRLFNGKLKMIDFKFSKSDDDDDKIEKVNEMIGFGDIDNFIDDEEHVFDEDARSDDDMRSRSSSSDEDEKELSMSLRDKRVFTPPPKAFSNVENKQPKKR